MFVWLIGYLEIYHLSVKGYKNLVLDNLFFQKEEVVTRYRNLEQLRATSFRELETAGVDGVFYNAKGRIKGNDLVMWSEEG